MRAFEFRGTGYTSFAEQSRAAAAPAGFFGNVRENTTKSGLPEQALEHIPEPFSLSFMDFYFARSDGVLFGLLVVWNGSLLRRLG